MKVAYFPGCTLTNKAKGLNNTAKQCAGALGVELVELDKWYCCQANYSMAKDSLMTYLSSVRTLVEARKAGEKLVVLCSTCYYALKRINRLMEENEENRKVVFEFIEEEYKGPVEVIHFLELIRDDVGFDVLKEKIKKPLTDMAVAPYYGCQLLRPTKELAFDDPHNPVIFEQFLEAIGCKAINYPFKTECCGSYLPTLSTEAVEDCVSRILKHAKNNGAEAITTSCPLCNFNLDWSQEGIIKKNEDVKSMPVFYFTELMAMALGIEIPQEIWDEHVVDPRSLLVKE